MSDGFKLVAEALRGRDGYDERLDALLAMAADLSGCPDAYLYLLDASERRLMLAQSRARPALDPTRSAPLPMQAQVEGGAEFSAPTAPLELPRTDEHDQERTLTTPVGPMHALPLRRADGALLGQFQLGPLPKGHLRRRALRRLHAAVPALAGGVEQARREHDLHNQLAAAKTALEGGRRLAGSAVDLDRFVALLLELALNTTGAAGGFVAIVDPDAGGLTVRSEQGMPPGFAERVDLDPDTGLFDWSPAVDGGALIVRDFEAAADLGLHALLAVPLAEGGDPLGVFALDLGGEAAFDESTIELLETFADQVRLMLYNARLFGDFSDRYLGTVEGLARALDARRPHTRGHHERVADVAERVAAELHCSDAERTAIREAGLIHDVGLAGAIGVEGGADADVEHPTLGASLIEHLPLAPAVAGAVATHHEWHDGWGFPKGLSGDDIPPAGRVLALAEFVVEMSTSDQIREAWSPEQLAAEIAHRRGSQFHPDVADAALSLVKQGAMTWSTQSTATMA
jgi:HD-GYP domain-containing protein (c-di-GMP phosphodiesterase class II)